MATGPCTAGTPTPHARNRALSVSNAAICGRMLRAILLSTGIDMMPWIQVSGMSPRTTGMRAFSRRIASLKSESRPRRIFTPGSFCSASFKRFATSSAGGGPWLSLVWISASQV